LRARSKARKRAVDILYAADMRGVPIATVLAERVGSPETPVVNDYTVVLVEGVAEHRQRLDELLMQHAEGWALERMPAVDRAILRRGLYELLLATDVDNPVVIDEAVELAKSLSTDDSPRFVNGVLGRVAAIAEKLRAVL
jgi:N utilization substance protein B